MTTFLVNCKKLCYGIRTRSKHKASVGKSHVISKQEAKDFVSKEFGVTIV